MKFISKSGRLNIILEPGIPANYLTGTSAKGTVFVKFESGIAEVEDPKLIEKMLAHPGFNQDFIAADEVGTDPFSHYRKDNEPDHVITEMIYGHPGKRTANPIKANVPPEVMKLIKQQATEIAQKMLPKMVAATLKEMAAEAKREGKLTDTKANAAEEGGGKE